MFDKKYYLIKYTFKSLGDETNDYSEDIEIIDISYEKEPLLEYIENYFIKEKNKIKKIDVGYNNQWNFDLKPTDRCSLHYGIFKIIEREN